MLDDYLDSQNIVYSTIKNSITNNRVSHAYLIDSNNFFDVKGFINAFCKILICPYNYSNNNNCGSCNKCLRIDNNNYTEVRHIYPIGNVIRKEQLMNLQEDYNLVSVEGSRMVYVIWNCELMNSSCANSILKFLEEPINNITAILVTSNIDALLPTIISRCQYLKLSNCDVYFDDINKNVLNIIKNINYDLDDDIDGFIDSLLDNIINYINYFEDNGIDTLVYIKKLWLDLFTDRSDFILSFNLIIQFYYDILNYKLTESINFYVGYDDLIINISSKLSISDIIYRIKVYDKYLNLVKCNCNVNMIMDSLIIELGE